MTIKILNNPSEKEIIENLKLGVPFKLLGRMENWPLMKKWNFEFFRKNFGENEFYVKDLTHQDLPKIKFNISKYIDYIGDKNNKSLYYASDLNIEKFSKDLFNDYDMNFLDDLDILRNYIAYNELRWIFLGKKGTFTGLHLDVYGTAAWLGLISGKKRFYFYNREDTEKIKIFSELVSGINILNLDEDFSAFFSMLNPLVVDVHPGEIIFTPTGYYHYVVNLEDSIALTENFSFKEIENDIAKVLLSIGDYPTYIQFKIVSCRFYLIFIMVVIISLVVYFTFFENKNVD
jgi:histone arginine demethylase JMJD6